MLKIKVRIQIKMLKVKSMMNIIKKQYVRTQLPLHADEISCDVNITTFIVKPHVDVCDVHFTWDILHIWDKPTKHHCKMCVILCRQC